jgi:uncharacterized membrane protein
MQDISRINLLNIIFFVLLLCYIAENVSKHQYISYNLNNLKREIYYFISMDYLCSVIFTEISIEFM